ncbi:MAG: hypothetical protein M3O62_16695 [Pseudomonadota bacterium]|nr:hypothetical protein [Pseudomonadota bacterium]
MHRQRGPAEEKPLRAVEQQDHSHKVGRTGRGRRAGAETAALRGARIKVLLVSVLELSLEVDAQIAGGPSAPDDQVAPPLLEAGNLDQGALKNENALIELYAANASAPVWVQFGAPSSQAIGLLHELQNASAMGLDPSD